MLEILNGPGGELGGEFNSDGIGRRRYRECGCKLRDAELFLLKIEGQVISFTPSRRVGSQALVHAVNLGELDSGIQNHLFYLGLGQIASRVGTDIRQAVPLVHAKLAYSNLDVETVVVVLGNVAAAEIVHQHVLMNVFTALDFRDETPSRLGERAQCISEEILPPLVRAIVGTGWATACSNTNKHTNVSTGDIYAGATVHSATGPVQWQGPTAVSSGRAPAYRESATETELPREVTF